MESASIADVEAHALVDGYLEGGRRVVVDKAIYGAYRAGRNAQPTDYEVHRAVFRMAAPVCAEIRQGGPPMAEGKQVRPCLFEADLPKDPRKPIRHPFDAVPYTTPDRILDEEGLLRRLMAAPDRVLC